ncbi:MAG: DUF6159 family protein [Candidatus Nanopelagicales bacterium]
MSAWTDSKVVTSKSWAVIRDNKYLLMFPVLGFLFSLVPMALFWIPAAWFLANNQNVIGGILAVIGVFGTTAAMTFSTGALVAAADTELSGQDSSIDQGFKRALTRSGALLWWSVILTVVTLLLSALRGNNTGGAAAGIMRGVLAAIADVAWQLVTFFVLPIIIIEGSSPIEAIKASATLFRRKWGTQLAGGVRIGGLILLVAILPAIVGIVAGFFLTVAGTWAVGVPLMVLGVLVYAAAGLVAAAMRAIFSVALYRYAHDGRVEGPFTEQELQYAVRTR